MFINLWLVNDRLYQAADWRVAVNQSTTPPWTFNRCGGLFKKVQPRANASQYKNHTTCHDQTPRRPRLIDAVDPASMMDQDQEIRSYVHLVQLPRADDALRMLRLVASAVKPIMRKHRWRVGELSEFYPDEETLMGTFFFKSPPIYNNFSR